MNTEDMIVTLWELAGEPSDLDPFTVDAPSTATEYLDASSTGVAHYLREISQAQVMLSNWRTNRGRPIRFDRFYETRNVKVGVTNELACTIPDSSTVRITTTPTWMTSSILDFARADITWTGIVDGADESSSTTYTRAIMTGEESLTNSMDLYLEEEIEIGDDDITSSITCTITFDRFKIERATGLGPGSWINMPLNYRNIMRLTTTSDGGKLEQIAYREDLTNYSQTQGTPSEWYCLGDKLFFDNYVEDPLWLIVEYQRVPNDVTSLTDSIDIPQEWHSVLISLVEWKEAKRMQDVEKELMLKTQLNQIIGQLRTDAEEKFLRDETSGFYVNKDR